VLVVGADNEIGVGLMISEIKNPMKIKIGTATTSRAIKRAWFFAVMFKL
jgi:hypothetical protein